MYYTHVHIAHLALKQTINTCKKFLHILQLFTYLLLVPIRGGIVDLKKVGRVPDEKVQRAVREQMQHGDKRPQRRVEGGQAAATAVRGGRTITAACAAEHHLQWPQAKVVTGNLMES
jgi:hypothetical protein